MQPTCESTGKGIESSVTKVAIFTGFTKFIRASTVLTRIASGAVAYGGLRPHAGKSVSSPRKPTLMTDSAGTVGGGGGG